MSAPESVFAERRRGRPEPRRLEAHELEAIKAAHPVVEVAGQYGIQLARSGPRFVALCPFHAETHPSFTLFPASNSWWCFGCRRGGDVIDLVRLLDGVSFREAVASLCGAWTPRPDAAGERWEERGGDSERWLAARASAEGQRALDVAVACYRRELEDSADARRYLARRGISGVLAHACSLGYCSGARLREALREAVVPLRIAWDVGLLVGREGVERFAGRVVIPEIRAGHAHWLTGRLLNDGDDAPRYMSLPGTRPLLGAERIAGRWAVVGTEGPFDYLTLTGWGIPAFAALGGSLSPNALADLREARVIYLAFDRDTPGQQAARALALRFEGRARIAVLPADVKDVNELGQRPDGRLAFQACVVKSTRSGASTGVSRTMPPAATPAGQGQREVA